MVEVSTIIRITELEFIISQLELQAKHTKGEERQKIIAQLENFWHELDTLEEFMDDEGEEDCESDYIEEFYY